MTITESQWTRILAGRRMRVLVSEEQREWAGKNARLCLSCDHAGDIRGIPQRGWCRRYRFAVANSYPVLCRDYA